MVLSRSFNFPYSKHLLRQKTNITSKKSHNEVVQYSSRFLYHEGCAGQATYQNKTVVLDVKTD